MSQASDASSPGRPVVSVYADGGLIGLYVHVREGTGLAASEYPAERRVVLRIGGAVSSGGVSVFLSAPALAGLIDVLNASYTRLASPPAAVSAVPARPAA
jgi:hypothetical protein